MSHSQKILATKEEERWDYDSDVPRREILDYWVMFFSQDKTKYTTEQLIEEYIKTL